MLESVCLLGGGRTFPFKIEASCSGAVAAVCGPSPSSGSPGSNSPSSTDEQNFVHELPMACFGHVVDPPEGRWAAAEVLLKLSEDPLPGGGMVASNSNDGRRTAWFDSI